MRATEPSDEPSSITTISSGGRSCSSAETSASATYAAWSWLGTTTLMHTIDPDMVLIGGAMTFGGHETEFGRRFLQRIKDEVKVRAFPVPYAKTKIDYATLGGDAGYIGAAGCARLKFGPKSAT